MRKKLDQLIENDSIAHYRLQEGVPTMEGDTESRLIDILTLTFHNGDEIKISTFCSGCLQNTSLIIE